MGKISFQNFDLLIAPDAVAPTRYRARVVDSPAGQATVATQLPFDLAQVTEIHRLLRQPKSVPADIVRAWGEQLYAALFAGEVNIALRRSLDLTAQPDKGLRLRLQLADDALLWALPWELLYEPVNQRFLAQSPTTPIVRTVPLARKVAPVPFALPLKILVVLVNPEQQAQSKSTEWAHIQASLAEAIQNGNVELTLLRTSKFAGLQQHLRQSAFHVVHLIGPEGFHTAADSNALSLLLHHQPALRLVVLTGKPLRNRLSSLAIHQLTQQLLQQGIPAVAAAQFMQQSTALAFVGEFYRALIDHYPLDAAMSEARVAVAIQQERVWGLPILGMLTADGELFQRPVDAKPSYADQPATKSDLEKSKMDSELPAYDLITALPNLPIKWPSLWRTPRLADAPEIQEWVNMARLKFNPFGPEQAEWDPELALHRVYPQVFDRCLHHTRSAIVFGVPGSGKTACQFLLAQSCHNRPPEAGAFPVICEIESGTLINFTNDAVQDFVVEHLTHALVAFFALNPVTFLRLESDGKFAVMACLRHVFRSIESAKAQFGVLRSVRDDQIRWLLHELDELAPQLEQATFTRQGWVDIISKARPHGFVRTYFICDVANEALFSLTNDVAFLQGLIRYVVSPDLKAVYLKALLPDVLQAHLQIPEHVITDRLSWTVDALAAMLRLRVFDEKGFPMYFEELFDQETRPTNPARRLAQAADGSPRRLIRLGNRLLAEHVRCRPGEIDLANRELSIILGYVQK